MDGDYEDDQALNNFLYSLLSDDHGDTTAQEDLSWLVTDNEKSKRQRRESISLLLGQIVQTSLPPAQDAPMAPPAVQAESKADAVPSVDTAPNIKHEETNTTTSTLSAVPISNVATASQQRPNKRPSIDVRLDFLKQEAEQIKTFFRVRHPSFERVGNFVPPMNRGRTIPNPHPAPVAVPQPAPPPPQPNTPPHASPTIAPQPLPPTLQDSGTNPVVVSSPAVVAMPMSPMQQLPVVGVHGTVVPPNPIVTFGSEYTPGSPALTPSPGGPSPMMISFDIWALEARATLAEQLLTKRTAKDVAVNALSFLTDTLKLLVAEIYMNDEGGSSLSLCGNYPAEKRIATEISYPCEKLIVQAVMERKFVHTKHQFSTTAGQSCVSVMAIPLIMDGEVKAVAVLASVADLFPQYSRMLSQCLRCLTIALVAAQARASTDQALDRALKQLRDLHQHSREIYRREMTEQSVNKALNAVLTAASDTCFTVTDLQGAITYFNPGAENVLGYSAAEVIGRCSVLQFHLDSEISTRVREVEQETGTKVTPFEALTFRARKGIPDRSLWTYVKKDGSVTMVDLTVTVVRDNQESVGYLEIARTIKWTPPSPSSPSTNGPFPCKWAGCTNSYSTAVERARHLMADHA